MGCSTQCKEKNCSSAACCYPDARSLRRSHGLVNGALFAGYHLHVRWMMPSVLIDMFVLAYPARRYRSALLSIAVHSSQTIAIVLLTLGAVVGYR